MNVDPENIAAVLQRFNRESCEPYLVQIPADQQPFGIYTVKRVSDGWAEYQAIITAECWNFIIPVLEFQQYRAVAGDKIALYGKGIGHLFSGIRINDKVVYWRDLPMQVAHHRRLKENLEAARRRHCDGKPIQIGYKNLNH